MKVLYIAGSNPSITFIKEKIQEFTVHNGCYPQRIEMSVDALCKFQSLLVTKVPLSKLKFGDIPIKEEFFKYQRDHDESKH